MHLKERLRGLEKNASCLAITSFYAYLPLTIVNGSSYASYVPLCELVCVTGEAEPITFSE